MQMRSGNNPMTRQTRQGCGMGRCGDDMKMLRAIDFAIQETVLFLNAYPEDRQALAYYHKLMEQRAQLLAAYEKSNGPVSMYGNRSHNSWDWIEDPWPWEPEAN